MKLYVVVASETVDGDNAVGVYSTRALAEAGQQAHNDVPTNSHAWGITELELDAMAPSTENEVGA